MAFGETVIQLTDLYAAPLEADNTFGTPVRIPVVEEFKFEFEHDEDEIKAYGVLVELLSVPIGATSEATEAKLDWATWPVLVGATPATTGVDPNQIESIEIAGGGEGVPYHGLMSVFATTNNQRLAVGFCKSKVMSIPGFDMGQNQFRRGKIEWKHVAGSDAIRKFWKAQRYQTAGDLVDFSVAANWDTFFTGFFS